MAACLYNVLLFCLISGLMHGYPNGKGMGVHLIFINVILQLAL